jgi:molecular chaperone DnaJ
MDYNKNYYQELELDKNATIDQIKKQYRKLALKYHPDKNKNSVERFQRINEANSVLSNEKSKNEYDTRSPHGKSYSPGFGSFGNFGGFSSGFDFNFSDIFEQFFGGNPFGGREEFKENLDINSTIQITLKDIYLNDNKKIKYQKQIHCDECNGTGFDRNSHSDTCEICNGTGVNRGQTCEYCLGEGKIYTGECKKCKGNKVVLTDSEINLQSLSKLRGNIRNAYSGYGHQSKYYRNKVGKLILNVNIEQNKEFKIVNDFDLQKDINVHFQDCIDGNEITIKHVDNKELKIKLNEKTNDGNFIRLKNKGLLKNEINRGDLFLKINIIIDYNRI